MLVEVLVGCFFYSFGALLFVASLFLLAAPCLFADCPCDILQRVFVMPNMDDLVIPILRDSQGEGQTDDPEKTHPAFSTSS